MKKYLGSSPFMPFYAMNFDHRITYVAAYLDTLSLTCVFSHIRLLIVEAHTKLLRSRGSYQASRKQNQFDYFAIQIPLNFTLITDSYTYII